MGALRVGDEVFDENGTPTRVTFATEVQHERECFAVRFDDGSTIIADADHRWLTSDRSARRAKARGGAARPIVRTTREIAATLFCGKERNHAVTVTAPLALSAAALPVEPYTFGVWLGDGDSKSATITQGMSDADELRALLMADGTHCGVAKKDPKSAACRWTIGTRPYARDERGRMSGNGSIHSALRALGVLSNKHIPMAYKRASAEQRMALLQGLMDTDGHIERNGNAELTLTHKPLAFDAFEVVVSLGFKATISESAAKIDGREVGRRWRISWTPRRQVFRFQRKAERVRNDRAQMGRTAQRFIASVTPVPSVPVRCITVDAPSHLFLAGQSMIPTHNSRTGAEWVRAVIASGAARRVALVARTAADVRDVLIEGESGILACCPAHERPVWEPSKRRLTWPSGAIATTYSAEEPDQLRGPQHDAAWCDELAAWRYPDAWDQLQMGLRLGSDPRVVVTTTPRPTPIVRALASSPTTRITRGRTADNARNLAPGVVAALTARYGATRLGRQELDGEILTDAPGALWTWAMIDRSRAAVAPPLQRVVVAIDPAVTSHEGSDETGIVVAGLAFDGRVYVLADVSGRYAPTEWAHVAVAAYRTHRADRIVAEVNNGGDMVASVLRMVDAAAPVRTVHASRGKAVRAEPVAALYEQGRVVHVGVLSRLEDQLTSWEPSSSRGSPDRLDALVWALTDLVVEPQRERAPLRESDHDF